MAKIRRELHEDVRGVVASAEAVTDWKHYVRTYPWLAVGLAVAVGFLVVPKRRRPRGISAAEIPGVVRAEIAQVVQAEPLKAVPVEAPKPKGKGLISILFGMIAPVAIRAAQGYATQYLGNWISQQQGAMAEQMAAAGLGPIPGMGPMPGPGMGPSRGPGMGMPGMPPNRGV